MGTPNDASFRKDNHRVDSIERQAMVDKARKIIKGGKAVGGKPVKRVLNQSNAPIEVRGVSPPFSVTIKSSFLECIFQTIVFNGFRHLLDARCGCFA